jgi:hypothetical protein
MRILLLFIPLFAALHLGQSAIATVDYYQEKQAEQLCQVNPSLCK